MKRFRTRVRRGKNGQAWVSYYWDGTARGRGEVALGTNYDQAVRKWEELEGLRQDDAGTLEQALSKFKREVLPNYDSSTTQRDYGLCLTKLSAAFGPATWEEVTTPALARYRDQRSAKTRANRELAVLGVVWRWAREWGYTALPYPGQGMRKNPEKARRVEVTDAVFDALYAQADPVLRDVMDWITATGLRVKDVLKLQLTDVRDGAVRVDANKTGKLVDFVIAASGVLPGLIERRKANKRALHLMMLTTETGRQVNYGKLRSRFEKARAAAAEKVDEPLATAIRKTILRDLRKRAANLAGDMAEAAKLLQHSSAAVTARHYRTKGEKVSPVR